MKRSPVAKIFTIALVMTGIARFSYAEDVSADSVLAKMQSFDKIYSASFTARGKVTYPPPFNAPHLPVYPRSWVFTQSGKRSALIETTRDLPLHYRPAKDFEKYQNPAGIAYDPDGNMVMSLITGYAASFEADRSASADLSAVFLISPAGKVLSQKENKYLTYHDPNATQLGVPIRVLHWTLGRGFTAYMDKLEEVKVRDDGLLEVNGIGFFNPREARGRWALTVDPKAQYLVRSAQLFAPASAKHPKVTVENRDIKRDRECTYPVSGECELHGEIRRFTVQSASLTSVESVMTEARKITSETSAPRTAIVDRTVVPHKSSYIDERGINANQEPEKPGATAQSTKGSLRYRVIIVNLVLIAVLSLFLCFRGRRRKKPDEK